MREFKYWPLLTGPTGSGKSSIAMVLAELTDGAIVGFDAMQVYRGMDIGTAKATIEDQRNAPHYLIDIRDPEERFSVREWYEEALPVLDQLKEEGRLPIGVGGTPQYVTSMIEGVVPGELPQDLVLRRSLYEEGELGNGEGWDALYSRLKAIDPKKANALHPNDHRRVVRALEIHMLTGKRVSDLEGEQRQLALDAVQNGHREEYPFQVFAIDWPREVLYERINQRVDLMLEQGLKDEVLRIYEQTKGLQSTSRQSIGYKEFFGWLEGERSWGDAVEAVKQNSRRYAKRQLSWYRHKEWITWLTPKHPEVQAELILKMIRN